jgi:hypothetical protein
VANFPNKDLEDDAAIETLDRTLARVLNVIENADADQRASDRNTEHPNGGAGAAGTAGRRGVGAGLEAAMCIRLGGPDRTTASSTLGPSSGATRRALRFDTTVIPGNRIGRKPLKQAFMRFA